METLTYDHPKAVKSFLGRTSFRNDFDGLSRLMKEFLRFPYENFTKVIHSKTAKHKDDRYRFPEVIWDEHQQFGAGGTCFSLTYFFETVLKNSGFECYSVMVDRSYGKNTHCAIIVTLNRQKYLVDPGYCLSRPILLTPKESIHKLPHNTYLLTPVDLNKYHLSTVQNGAAKVRYILKDVPILPDEFLKFWDESFGFAMMDHLCVTKLQEDGYLYLRDKFLRHVTLDSKKQETIKTFYDKRISELFGISPELVKMAGELNVRKQNKS